MSRLGLLIPILIVMMWFGFRQSPHTSTPVANKSAQISWMSFEEAIEANKINPKKILVSVHTEWCGWCKHMDRTTFKDSMIIAFINQHFYPVKLDAEQQTDIATSEKVYKSKKSNGKERGFHELAVALTMGRLTLPSTVFLDEDVRVLQPIPGYKDPKTFEMIMTYYGNDHFKSTPWTTYQKSYIPLKKLKPILISE